MNAREEAEAMLRYTGVVIQDRYNAIVNSITAALEVRDREIERLRAGGCARDQRTTQFCAEASRMAQELTTLRAQLAECVKVLKPFAEASHVFNQPIMVDAGLPYDDSPLVAHWPLDLCASAKLEVGHLRAASTLLTRLQAEKGEK